MTPGAMLPFVHPALPRAGWGLPLSNTHSTFNGTKNELPPLLVSIDEAARLLSVAPQTLRNQLSLGKLPFATVRLGGRRLVVYLDLVDFVQGLRGNTVLPAKAQAAQQTQALFRSAPRRHQSEEAGTRAKAWRRDEPLSR